MNSSNYLRAKADGVDDILKWLKTKQKDGEYMSMIDIIVGTDKYKKKLKHQADELEDDY